VIPHLQPDYFESTHRLLFTEICNFVGKYNALPTKDPLLIDLVDSPRIGESAIDAVAHLATDLFVDFEQPEYEWLLNTTEKWCQDASMRNAIMASVDILDGKDKKRSKDAIPSIMQQALSVCFDTSIGHDYFGDAAARWAAYRDKPMKIPFHLPLLNEITDGGYERGTLNMFLAGIHVGKTLAMASTAAGAVMDGRKVLYVTLEDGEHKIAARIDANLINKELSELQATSEASFMAKINALKAKTEGNLIIRQFPAASIHVGHIRALLDELKLKKNFVPDVIFVDYANLMLSSRVRKGGNLYEIVKSVAEELRGLAVEYGVAIWSATQLTRSGMGSSDVDMTDTSESIGLPATLDFYLYIGQPDAFKANSQYFMKQLKNRYKNLDYKERFVLGVDKPKQRIYEPEEQAQLGILQSNGTISSPPPVDTTPDYSNFNFGE
jgi:hypothetical protein